MTIIEMTGAPTEVPAPSIGPLPFGLFSVLTPSTNDRALGGGATFVDELCDAVPLTTTNDCLDPNAAALLISSAETVLGCVSATFDPFTVWAHGAVSMGRYRDGGEAAASIARRRLEAVEQEGVEQALWTAMLAVAATNVAVANARRGLGVIEQIMAETLPGQGVLHMNRLAATVLIADGVLRVEGQRLVTALGTPVVAGAGYDRIDGADDTTPVILGTGPLIAVRGTVDLLNAADHETNRWAPIAQRTWVVGWACTPAPIRVTITV